jgi:hypothetical protein
MFVSNPAKVQLMLPALSRTYDVPTLGPPLKSIRATQFIVARAVILRSLIALFAPLA